MSELKPDDVRTMVRDHYAEMAKAGVVKTQSGCCTPKAYGTPATTLGYSAHDASAVPDGADLGLGCGNPTAIASLRGGETVLDLGAGAGFDSFIAAKAVGPEGRVIGVDMTAEMVARARANARKVNAANVEFRLGEIEHLPVADATVDVILSNCVINLSPEKGAVFAEAFRVLKPGGRLAISDVVAIAEIPDDLRRAASAIASCISGAAPLDEVRALLARAGFTEVTVEIAPRSAEIVSGWLPGVEKFIASATIEARKPGPTTREGREGREGSEGSEATGEPGEARGCCGPSCCA